MIKWIAYSIYLPFGFVFKFIRSFQFIFCPEMETKMVYKKIKRYPKSS